MKKTIAVLLSALLLFACLPFAAFAEAQPAGTVTVSIVDNGDRDYLLDYCEEEDMQYLTPFGVIVPETEVPYYEGETVAKVLTRLFEMKGIIILQCSLDIDQRRSSQCNVEAFAEFL